MHYLYNITFYDLFSHALQWKNDNWLLVGLSGTLFGIYGNLLLKRKFVSFYGGASKLGPFSA